MASIGHVAIGLCCARVWSPKRALTRRSAVAFSALALWPDLDALGFLVGIPYGDQLGHRGATHSIAMSLFVGLASYVFATRRGLPPARTTLLATIASLSHGLLDTMTYGGGKGCALLWPFTDARYWSPVRFIPVAPIGARLVSFRGLRVMAAELVIFLPFWLYALWPRRSGRAGT